MIDRDFRKNENKITIPVESIRANQPSFLEIKRSGREEVISKALQEYDDKGENITATYWG